jgi:hypothetical protein
MSERKDMTLRNDFHSETTRSLGVKALDQPAVQPVNVTNSQDIYENETKEWYPGCFISIKKPHSTPLCSGKFLGGQENSTSDNTSEADWNSSKFALIILNQPIELELDIFLEIWKKGIFVINEVG